MLAVVAALVAIWLMKAFYTVQPNELGQELVFGRPKAEVAQQGLHFHFWPVETVEKGLRAAKAAGVPVDLDGAAQKPPASALAVVRTGFGPEAVPAKKPVPPPRPVPKVSPLGRSAATAAKPVAPKGPARGAAPTAAPAAAALRRPPCTVPRRRRQHTSSPPTRATATGH